MQDSWETRFKRLTTELENSQKIRDQFVSLASHDLRTPIAVMKLYVDSLIRFNAKGTLTNEELQKRLQKASEQCMRLDELLTFLVDTARASTGRVTLKKQRLDLLTLAGSLAEGFADRVKAAGTTITASGVTSVGTWDKSKLTQILSNLVINAIKHAPGTAIELSVEDLGDRSAITVRDGGPGIPAENHGVIFERITQIVHKGDEGEYEITLPVLWQIARAMGGTLTLESPPGTGAAFKLTLPKA